MIEAVVSVAKAIWAWFTVPANAGAVVAVVAVLTLLGSLWVWLRSNRKSEGPAGSSPNPATSPPSAPTPGQESGTVTAVTEAAVRAAREGDRDEIERLREQLNAALETRAFTEGAVSSFLSTLDRASVPAEDLPGELASLARRHLDLLRKNEELERTARQADNDAVSAADLEAAEDAIGDGDYDQAEVLLAEAERAEDERAARLAERADEAAAQAAGIAEQRAEIALQRFDRATAAGLFARAAEKTPDRDTRARMLRHGAAGDAWRVFGDSVAALKAYRNALTAAETLAASDPSNSDWRRDLSVSHDRIGDVLMAQGDGAGALAAYREAMTIRETLAASDPSNSEWRRDLSVSHNKIGDVLRAQGDGAGALAAYREAMTIRETLAASDPSNSEWRRDLCVSLFNLAAMDDGPEARARRVLEAIAAVRARGAAFEDIDEMARDARAILDGGVDAPAD